MDVRQWRIAVLGESGQSSNQPGLALLLKLQCPVCKSEFEVSRTKRIYPEMFRRGNPNPYWHGGPYGAGWASHWFDNFVNHNLAEQRSCDECGMVSVIPPRQAQALIEASNAAMSPEWLSETVVNFHFDTREIYDKQYHNFSEVVFVGKPGMTAMAWEPLSGAGVVRDS